MNTENDEIAKGNFHFSFSCWVVDWIGWFNGNWWLEDSDGLVLNSWAQLQLQLLRHLVNSWCSTSKISRERTNGSALFFQPKAPHRNQNSPECSFHWRTTEWFISITLDSVFHFYFPIFFLPSFLKRRRKRLRFNDIWFKGTSWSLTRSPSLLAFFL